MSDLFEQTRRALERATRDAERALTQAASETQKALQAAAETTTRGLSDATAQLHAAVAGETTSPPLNLATLPPASRAAFYGALFAMANADGAIDKDELAHIVALLDVEDLPTGVRAALQHYLIEPPRLLDTLRACGDGDDALRYGLMVNLVGVAWANDLIAPEQRYALTVAQQHLRIDDAQLAAIEAFVQQAQAVRHRGVDDRAAAESLKQATAGLTAVGVPVAAVYLSGSVIGLSAAGITSGLAALGLGLGMVPGIGVAVLLGVAAYLGVTRLLGGGDEHLIDSARRKAQLVDQHLQETADLLSAHIAGIERGAAGASTPGPSLAELQARLRALQQIIAKRGRLAGS